MSLVGCFCALLIPGLELVEFCASSFDLHLNSSSLPPVPHHPRIMSAADEEAQAAQELAELNAGELGHADGPVTPEEAKQLDELAELLKESVPIDF